MCFTCEAVVNSFVRASSSVSFKIFAQFPTFLARMVACNEQICIREMIIFLGSYLCGIRRTLASKNYFLLVIIYHLYNPPTRIQIKTRETFSFEQFFGNLPTRVSRRSLYAKSFSGCSYRHEHTRSNVAILDDTTTRLHIMCTVVGDVSDDDGKSVHLI